MPVDNACVHSSALESSEVSTGWKVSFDASNAAALAASISSAVASASSLLKGINYHRWSDRKQKAIDGMQRDKEHWESTLTQTVERS